MTVMVKIVSIVCNLLKFLWKKSTEDLIRDWNTVSKIVSDYQLHSLSIINATLSTNELRYKYYCRHPAHNRFKKKASKLLMRSKALIQILIARHNAHYRMYRTKSFEKCVSISMRSHNLPVRFKIFLAHQNSATKGSRYPCVFWQESPLGRKIQNYGSLQEIYSSLDEQMCSICYTDGQKFEDSFAIFMGCNHLVCVPCVESLTIFNNHYDDSTR